MAKLLLWVAFLIASVGGWAASSQAWFTMAAWGLAAALVVVVALLPEPRSSKPDPVLTGLLPVVPLLFAGLSLAALVRGEMPVLNGVGLSLWTVAMMALIHSSWSFFRQRRSRPGEPESPLADHEALQAGGLRLEPAPQEPDELTDARPQQWEQPRSDGAEQDPERRPEEPPQDLR